MCCSGDRLGIKRSAGEVCPHCAPPALSSGASETLIHCRTLIRSSPAVRELHSVSADHLSQAQHRKRSVDRPANLKHHADDVQQSPRPLLIRSDLVSEGVSACGLYGVCWRQSNLMRSIPAVWLAVLGTCVAAGEPCCSHCKCPDLVHPTGLSAVQGGTSTLRVPMPGPCSHSHRPSTSQPWRQLGPGSLQDSPTTQSAPPLRAQVRSNMIRHPTDLMPLALEQLVQCCWHLLACSGVLALAALDNMADPAY